MADTFYGISVGHGLDPAAVTVAASTTSLPIELRVLDGAGLSKSALLLALDTIKARVVENNAPA